MDNGLQIMRDQSNKSNIGSGSGTVADNEGGTHVSVRYLLYGMVCITLARQLVVRR